jgi:uncharacterized protein YbjT (DUF2867 family)
VILVVGATGMLGSAICEGLRRRDAPVAALVRPGSPGEARLAALGCTIVHGDLKTPAALVETLRRTATVITTANSALSRRKGDSIQRVDLEGSLALVARAEQSGVTRFVYTSLSPVLPADNDFVRAKRAVESALRSSRMAWTILQPAAYMEIHAGPVAGWDFAAGRARIIGPGRAPMSYISIRDVAAIAVEAATHPAAARRAMHLAGPEPISALDAVRIAERVTGRTFTVQHAPLRVLKVLAPVVRPFNRTLASLMRMGIAGNLGDTADMTAILRDFPIEQTTFEQYVRRAIGDPGGVPGARVLTS